MVGRSGTVGTAQRRTCGQGRNVEGARQTFQQCCKGSASMRCSDSSSSGEREDKFLRHKDQSELLGLHEKFKKLEDNISSVQFKGAGEEGKPKELWKMEVDEEADSNKKLDQRKDELQKQVRRMYLSPDMPQSVVVEYKENWQQELPDIEQRRNDLLPEAAKNA